MSLLDLLEIDLPGKSEKIDGSKSEAEPTISMETTLVQTYEENFLDAFDESEESIEKLNGFLKAGINSGNHLDSTFSSSLDSLVDLSGTSSTATASAAGTAEYVADKGIDHTINECVNAAPEFNLVESESKFNPIDTNGLVPNYLIKTSEIKHSTFNQNMDLKNSILKSTLENGKLKSMRANDNSLSTFNSSLNEKKELLLKTIQKAHQLSEPKEMESSSPENMDFMKEIKSDTDKNNLISQQIDDIDSLHEAGKLSSNISKEFETYMPSKDSNDINASDDSKEIFTVGTELVENRVDQITNSSESLAEQDTNDLQVANEIIDQTSTFADFENAFSEPIREIVSDDDFDFDKTPTPSVTDFASFSSSPLHPTAPPSSPISGKASSSTSKPIEKVDSFKILNDLESEHLPSETISKAIQAFKEEEEKADFPMHPSANYEELEFEKEDLLDNNDQTAWWWKFLCF